MNRRLVPIVIAAASFCFPILHCKAVDDLRTVGVAKIDITPDYAVRLSGYGNRREESEGIEQHIWAKTLVFGGDAEKPAVLITVDNCGIPDAMRRELVARLAKKGVEEDRLAISFSHTHCGPCLAGALVNIFSMDIPPAHQANIDRYSRELTDKLERVVLAALADRKPARVSWAVGSASFARNRRAAWGGPVDHALPVMFVHGADGALRAVFANYACHATTLSFNKLHGDWPGTAMVGIERDHPGAVALIGIGCGADQNPHPRGTVELAVQHGEEVAKEVTRLLGAPHKSIGGKIEARVKAMTLPLDTLPTREMLQKDAASKTPNVAYIAQKNLARLDRGEKLPTELPYRVQVWNFGADLAMVFLPGEVTVDYGLRIKTEFDASRLWIDAYSNDALCYIPSQRVLDEGGYEGGGAMVYYDRPAKFTAGVEEKIIAAVHELMPREFSAMYRADVPPKPPALSMTSIKTRDGFTVELAAAEPFVMDPVAIDWDAHGRMWVVEQPDYPNGMDGNWKPGGRVKILTDTDGDGRYDRSTLVLEGIPFPTGVTCWREGALVCAAPDILFVEEGKTPKKLFTGFYTDNYNARVNSLALGLDNWIHGANGLLGGKVRSAATGAETDISGRDIRIQPDTGELQLVSGVTQQGRERDDWDNWFGCSNSRWIFHFPLPERYAKRNPHVPAPKPSVYLPKEQDEDGLNFISQPLDRFNNPKSLGHITSACGLGIYRDVLLGAEFNGNAFIGEVAHNLVRRYQLQEDGATFTAKRPEDERTREFFASTDNWTRPVQVRTGPDGALYIVDMYRAVIEHTRWIPADRLAKLDPRLGDAMGRIYRLFPKGAKLRKVADLTTLDAAALVAALDTPNGTTRDLVHQLLLQSNDTATHEPLMKLAAASKQAAVRVQALSVLDGLKALPSALLAQSLSDAEAHVRRHALRLSEGRADLFDACSKLAHDPDFGVRFQLALSLGESADARAAAVLADVARTALDDAEFRAAVLTSSDRQPREILDLVMKAPAEGTGWKDLVGQLIATAAAEAKTPEQFSAVLKVVASERPAPWQIAGMVQLQDALDRRGIKLASLDGAGRVKPLFDAAHRIATDQKSGEAYRETALRLFMRGFSDAARDQDALAAFLTPTTPDRLQKAALGVLSRSSDAKIADLMLAGWNQRAPSLRASIVTALLARDEWALHLLKAVEAHVVSGAEVPPASRQALAHHAKAEIRSLAEKLLPAANGAARGQVIAKYQGVPALRADPVHGAVVFKNVCSVCHTYIGTGMAVGPDLKAFYNKPAGDFVTAILDPNAAVDPRYTAYVVTTRDSRTLTGVVANETASSIDVVQPGGVRETILRADIRELKATGLSLMPEGLEQTLPPQDMADLIGYLKSGG
ncbi:MAG: neutral/alkaline non-lysosomal ceramidase N-terminal domain-containing protein [Verrucomicrobiaceae bacterium]|nr:neutral/alkaline non-lysosomal ceramidase N-terminal domain-containing protein [Verrucomicrobiaceae bacterium]